MLVTTNINVETTCLPVPFISFVIDPVMTVLPIHAKQSVIFIVGDVGVDRPSHIPGS